MVAVAPLQMNPSGIAAVEVEGGTNFHELQMNPSGIAAHRIHGTVVARTDFR